MDELTLSPSSAQIATKFRFSRNETLHIKQRPTHHKAQPITRLTTTEKSMGPGGYHCSFDNNDTAPLMIFTLMKVHLLDCE